MRQTTAEFTVVGAWPKGITVGNETGVMEVVQHRDLKWSGCRSPSFSSSAPPHLPLLLRPRFIDWA